LATGYLQVVRFVMFVIDCASGTASSGEISAIDAFNDELRANDQFVIAVGIGQPGTAERFDPRSTERPSKHSLQPSSEFYSGFWIIDAASRPQAALLAARASQACNRSVELRPLLG